MWLLDADGGDLRQFATARSIRTVRNPLWSPDGRWLLVVAGGATLSTGTPTPAENLDGRLVALDTSVPTHALDDLSSGSTGTQIRLRFECSDAEGCEFADSVARHADNETKLAYIEQLREGTLEYDPGASGYPNPIDPESHAIGIVVASLEGSPDDVERALASLSDEQLDTVVFASLDRRFVMGGTFDDATLYGQLAAGRDAARTRRLIPRRGWPTDEEPEHAADALALLGEGELEPRRRMRASRASTSASSETASPCRAGSRARCSKATKPSSPSSSRRQSTSSSSAAR